MLATGLVLAVGALVVSALCAAGIRLWATDCLQDIPNDRSLHTRLTPRGGGIGIVVVGLGIGAVSLAWQYRVGIDMPCPPGQMALIGLGALLVTVISGLDDLRQDLAPGFRLAAHIISAGLAIYAAGGWSRAALPLVGTINLNWVGYFIALIWVVGLVNAYNFMDGIDGIAGVQAVTAAGGWLAVGLLIGNHILLITSILLGFSTIGFLLHNWPPAKIFMGDIGSAFLGYCFAVIPLCFARLFSGAEAERVPVAGFLMVAPFVVDAMFTFLRRLIRGEKLTQAHRSHLYQRLVLTGLSHRAVTLLYFVLGLVGSVAGVSFIFMPKRTIANLSALSATLFILLVPLLWVLAREARQSKGAFG